MASVPLSQRLREDIVSNFEKQLGQVYRTKYNIQPAIDQVVNHLENSNNALQELISLEKTYQTLLPSLQKMFKVNLDAYHSLLGSHVLKPNNQLGLVCNPNRPTTDNFTWDDSWATPYTDEYSNERTDGKNYVEGDVGVKIENVDFYFPLQFNLRYKRGWREDGEHAPHADDYILFITDPDLCAAFSPVGEIEDRIGKETRQFKDALALKNTLKQFLDDWPGGKDLIPAEDIQRMTKTVKRSTTPKGVIDSIPNDLKESMNEVLLTNKLLGD